MVDLEQEKDGSEEENVLKVESSLLNDPNEIFESPNTKKSSQSRKSSVSPQTPNLFSKQPMRLDRLSTPKAPVAEKPSLRNFGMMAKRISDFQSTIQQA